MMIFPRLTLTVLALLTTALAGCSDSSNQPPQTTVASDPATNTPSQDHPVDQFMAAIARHCGQSFAGRIAANTPEVDDDPFAGQTLIMHVRECSDTELRIPFHVGDNHSRTWILTRTDNGLRLKHDHRHQDGSEDQVTMYGGDTGTPGTAMRQEFPVDQFSIDMFLAGGNTVSTTNTWAMEIEPDRRFLYELARPEGRLFQVEFDLSQAVSTPPTPWGHPPLP
jgi:hypothetical protein